MAISRNSFRFSQSKFKSLLFFQWPIYFVDLPSRKIHMVIFAARQVLVETRGYPPDFGSSGLDLRWCWEDPKPHQFHVWNPHELPSGVNVYIVYITENHHFLKWLNPLHSYGHVQSFFVCFAEGKPPFRGFPSGLSTTSWGATCGRLRPSRLKGAMDHENYLLIMILGMITNIVYGYPVVYWVWLPLYWILLPIYAHMIYRPIYPIWLGMILPICSMVLVSLSTKLVDFVGAFANIPAPWSIWVMEICGINNTLHCENLDDTDPIVPIIMEFNRRWIISNHH